jgi:integrase/recombinase XerD
MLSLFRRHGRRCQYKSRRIRNCQCPIWVDGIVGGREIRRTLKTRNWQRAQHVVRQMEAEDKAPDERITIEQACERFLQDAKARGLKAPSIEKYRPMFNRLKEFSKAEGLPYISQFDVDALRRFRAGWALKGYSTRNELERLRTLFRFAHEAKWISENPAKMLKAPKVDTVPAVPFSRDEMKRILVACDEYETTSSMNHKAILPIKAFVLVLRYSGLRIRDVVTLTRDKIVDGRLFLRTAKTGTQVRVPLPPQCLEALAAIPVGSGPYYFWSGFGSPKTRVANWQHALTKVFKLAKIDHGHAHRFRHTFSIELLLAGVPIERVSVLLGHRNSMVTSQHYSAWVQIRQDQLEKDVISTWI